MAEGPARLDEQVDVLSSCTFDALPDCSAAMFLSLCEGAIEEGAALVEWLDF